MFLVDVKGYRFSCNLRIVIFFSLNWKCHFSKVKGDIKSLKKMLRIIISHIKDCYLSKVKGECHSVGDNKEFTKTWFVHYSIQHRVFFSLKFIVNSFP